MKTQLSNKGYILDQEKNIWSRLGYGGIAYSDGDDTELRIGKIIDEATDLTLLSTELRQHCTDWPSLYHLSGSRANILRPFAKFITGDILEIGAGCGVITRYLGESGANVLALEGSPRRANITRVRTRDLENVTVLAEKFDQFQWDHQFDVITLIGVLEYANLFTSAENPSLVMLEQARRLLKPKGKLIVAIENQLGLKYFAGAPEDHLEQPMAGIEGRYREDQPQTFGRKVLSHMLGQADFAISNFLAPFPDYKLPLSILTEEGINNKAFDAAVFAWQSVRRDPQLPAFYNFSLELAWPQIFNNDMGLDFANSFLIIASPHAQQLIDTGALAYHYTTDRIPAYCKETVFTQIEGQDIRVQYQRLDDIYEGSGTDNTDNALIKFICPESDEYAYGELFSLEFIRIVTTDGWSFDQVAGFILRYLSIIETFAQSTGTKISLVSPYAKLPGDFFDVVPQNIIIRKDGSASLIDKEWKLTQPIEVAHLLFRALVLLVNSISRFSFPASGANMTRYQFIDGVLLATEIKLHEEDYDRYIRLEAEIQQIVTGRAAEHFLNWEKDQPLRMLSLNQAVVERDKQIANLNHALAERDGQIVNLKQDIVNLKQDVAGLYSQISNIHQQLYSVTLQLNGVITSKSWMLTQPLRDIRRNLVIKPISFIRKKLNYYIDLTYRRMPLSINQKQQLKNALFQKLPRFFSWAQKYQNWQKLNLKSPIDSNHSISSKVFDSAYYLVANPDLALAGIEPLQHYCTQGWREGRNPHPLFSVAYYLKRYPDVKKAGVNPLEHYLTMGWREGREPHPAFDTAFYCKAGWYTKKCGISPLEYYLRHRCAATGAQLAGFDKLLPRLQDGLPASSTAQIQSKKLEMTPLISILMPTYNTPAKHLEASITSVLKQSYEKWELCITDDGSVLPETRQVLERFRRLDSRIQVKMLGVNSGISAATNEALNKACGEFVAMLDHDDTLEPNALFEFVHELNFHPDTDAIYSDQDIITAEGERTITYFKPDWSPELMRGVMYVGHLLMVRRSLAIDIGGFDSKFDRVQDYEFMLRVGERTDRIRHISRILYHWKMIPGSIAHNGDSKGKVEPLQCAAVNAHMDRQGLAGQAAPHPVHAHRALIFPQPGAESAKITVIIGQTTTHEHLNSCLDSLNGKGIETEVLLFAADATRLSRPGLRVLAPPPSITGDNSKTCLTQLFSIALKEVEGDYVMFMERPMKLSRGWVERMALYAARPDVVLVCPLVINDSGSVAEAGLILHPHLGIEPAMSDLSPESDGMAGSLSCAREVSAVSATCVCFRRSMVQKIGGFDPLYRVLTFQIADAALKAINQGLSNLYVPTVTAMHFAAPPQAHHADQYLDTELFLDRWRVLINYGDRYHNPNYSPYNGGFTPF